MRALAALLPVALVLLAGCSDPDDGGAPPAETKEIAMHNESYVPDAVNVVKGTILRFAAHDAAHSAQTMDGMYSTGDIPQGTSKDLTMDKVGTFVLHCRYHDGMQMTATVTA